MAKDKTVYVLMIDHSLARTDGKRDEDGCHTLGVYTSEKKVQKAMQDIADELNAFRTTNTDVYTIETLEDDCGYFYEETELN